jgi:predicted AAA+ superfamily ATPase
VAPLSYREFLLALGLDACVELLDAGDLSRLKILKHEFLLALKQYFYVGGMPEAVSVFIETNDFSKTREVQRSIIDMYDQDFSKHAPLVQVPKIRQIWNSVPVQLAKENKKFQYSQLSPGARSREYELALLWLTDTNIVHQVHRVQEIKHPLNAYEDSASFKLYAVDIGLLACMSGLDKDVLFEGDRFFVEFKGSLAEQFVLQELISLSGADPTYKPFYWTNAGGKAEVDFIISVGKHIIPIEVKSGINLRAKSLQVYMQKYEPALALRCSPADYKAGGHITDLPLYALDRLPPECGR